MVKCWGIQCSDSPQSSVHTCIHWTASGGFYALGMSTLHIVFRFSTHIYLSRVLPDETCYEACYGDSLQVTWTFLTHQLLISRGDEIVQTQNTKYDLGVDGEFIQYIPQVTSFNH